MSWNELFLFLKSLQCFVSYIRDITIGVFHAMAGMAAAMPGLKKFPSAGKEIEANR